MDEKENTLFAGRHDSTHEDDAFRRLLRNVELTQDDEIDCTTCLDRVPVYVERALSGANVAQEMPEMHLHLVQCGDCFEEYEALRDLVELDFSGGLPSATALLDRLNGR